MYYGCILKFRVYKNHQGEVGCYKCSPCLPGILTQGGVWESAFFKKYMGYLSLWVHSASRGCDGKNPGRHGPARQLWPLPAM